MGDESLVSEAALAAYDAASARTFGRQVAEGSTQGRVTAGSSPLATWRTGEPGVSSVEEYDVMSGLTFGRYTGAQEPEARRQVETTRQQLAKEREVLERARRLGWETALMATPSADRAIAESVRARAGAPTAPEASSRALRSR